MARTTANAVIDLLSPGGDYDEENAPSVLPFIDTASHLVDSLESYASSHSITISSGRLEIIERWLAAHGYATSDRPYASRNTDGASGTFQGRTDMGLKATHYGQMALDLDPTGYLATLGEEDTRQTRISMKWLGRRPSRQTPYYQRD